MSRKVSIAKQAIITSILGFASGMASAALPVFSAQCSADISVDADKTGVVRINGKKASVKKSNETYYEARGAGVTISIALQSGEPPIVTYTGKGRANGVCQVSAAAAAAPAQPPAGRASSSERAGQGKFNATGNVPCAQNKGQPMGQCLFGVARDAGGTATVVVTMPDGRKRFIFFEKGKATGADLSQADGNMTFRARKSADLFMIDAGNERYEIPEAVVFGG